MGVIALDIDGTLTVGAQELPSQVVDFLSQLYHEGWTFIFLTGRTFSYGYHALKKLPFPFYFCVQNGALVLEMPSKRIVSKKYLTKDILPSLERIAEENLKAEFVIYSGFPKENCVFYRSHRFSPELLEYLNKRKIVFMEEWYSLEDLSRIEMTDFPAVKVFGDYETVQKAARKVEEKLSLEVPVIRDPFCEGYYLAQATHREVNKGKTLNAFIQKMNIKGIVIAAGDDKNDMSMLEVADIRIVMADAPEELLRLATIIAPPAEKMGIILGLKHAIKMC